MAGIVSYGFYVPKYRIKISEIASIWKKNGEEISNSLGVFEKAVAGVSEDSVTMAHESSQMIFNDFSFLKKEIGSVFFGSESPPYAVNPASTILAELLGIGNNYLAYDTQFACKAATGALISTFGLVCANQINYGLVVSSDKATGRPHDALEYTAGSGSVALLIGKENVAVEIVDWTSFSSDTPDFWRREGIMYPSHGGRFTGKPSYFRHIEGSVKKLLQKNNLKPQDFKYAIFHMPNAKFPAQIAKQLGFEKSQIENSLVVKELGNSYTSSALMGLVATLEHALPGDKILFSSYGSGAGSDAFVLNINENFLKIKKEFKKQISKKTYIDYATYLKFIGVF